MGIFLGTLIIVILCCLGLGAGWLLTGKPLSGGCGHKPGGAPRCADCPNKNRHRPAMTAPEGES